MKISIFEPSITPNINNGWHITFRMTLVILCGCTQVARSEFEPDLYLIKSLVLIITDKIS
jgi:hypothetical protein